jgi:uncharacterized protein (TIGR00255 family)
MDVVSMVLSMTGYGQAERQIAGVTVRVEMKSVNHRYCEVAIRLPREWLRFEDSLKRTVQQFVHRGRIEMYISYERDPEAERAVSVNWPLVDAYWRAAEAMKQKMPALGSLQLSDLLALPDVMLLQQDTDPAAEDGFAEKLKECAADALERLLQMRRDEGEHLKRELLERANRLSARHENMVRFAPLVVAEYRDKLHERIKELLGPDGQVDEMRFAMEVALFADRSDIDEELTRLASHIRQFRAWLDADGPVGRKLDFLIQEMNREVNTIGSKANHLTITNHVVEMKAELEKMREQIQNIE